MFLWIDPPSDQPGWIYYDVETGDRIAAVLAEHDIPADNQARKNAYDNAEERGQDPGVRTFWGITGLDSLPVPLPEGIIMVGPDERKPDEQRT